MAKTKRPNQTPIRIGKNKLPTRINVKLLQTLLWSAGALVFAVSAFFWYTKIYSSPERVFWGMVSNNLATAGVTRTVTQNQGENKSSESSMLSFGAEPGIGVLKDISQTGAEGSSRVLVEGVGTRTADYQRYTLIQRNGADGKPIDYTTIQDKWVKTGSNEQGTELQPPQLFNQVLLSSFIFGNIRAEKRGEVVNELKKAYQVDFSKAAKTNTAGKATYTYDVSIKLQNLASALQKYGQASGLASAAAIQPSNYADSGNISMKVTIAVASRQLVKVDYAAAGITEQYGSYGIIRGVEVPGETITLQKFNELINAIEK